jgi:hypothetical protein
MAHLHRGIGRARFRLRTNERSVLRCRIDRRKRARCRSHYRSPGLAIGRHRLEVIAADRAGNRTRRTKRFRVVSA